MVRYISVPLERIIPEEELPGDLYLYVSGHFIKYKHEGEEIPRGKYDDFIYKKVQYVFTVDKKIESFDQWYDKCINAEKNELLEKVGENSRDLVEDRMEVKRHTHRVFSNPDLTDEDCLVIQQKTRNLVEKVNTNKSVQKGLGQMMTFSRSLADHATNEATLSVYLGFHLGYNHQIILENLYLGALFHDYGKTLIDPKQLEDKDTEYIAKVMMKHPALGRSALKLRVGLPDEVLMIVGQHHERNDGKGFPKRLRGNRIYDLTKIVSIANYFDKLVVKAPGRDLKSKQKWAIAELEKDQGQMFDSTKLEKCLRVMKNSL